MRFSYSWLKELSGSKIAAEKMAELLTLHSFESQISDKKGKEVILEIDILPNRAHEGFSHLSVAKEISVLTGSKLKFPSFKLKEKKNLKTADFVSVKISNPKLCPRYAARMIEGIKVKRSPPWLKKRLEILGLNSINNIVDATNYVMLELGQPLHAFDAKRIASVDNKPTIIVRTSKNKERLTTLDGQKLELSQGVLLITDNKKPLAIAGIKGILGSEIKSDTKTIIIESANFEPGIIRKGSQLLNIKTDASARFSQNLSPDLVPLALDRVAYLIQKIAGGDVYEGMVDNYRMKLTPRRVILDEKNVEKLTGIKVSKDEITRILKRLGFEISRVNLFSKISDIIDNARKLIGVKYKYGASTTFDAPNCFDCSSFVKYLFRQIGVELPRVTIEQVEAGKKVTLKTIKPGDLIFSKGDRPHFNKKHPKGLGHVALYVGGNKVIHAVGGLVKKVVEEPLKRFVKRNQLRAVIRVIDEKINKDLLLVTVPTLRLDIEQEVDLIEEITRIKGYNNLKAQLPKHWLFLPEVNENFTWQEVCKNTLASLGFDEVYNYTFVGASDLETFWPNIKFEIISLANPLSAQLQYLRPTLLVQLIKNARDNLRYFNDFKIFELGKIYLSSIGKAPFRDEKMSLAGLLASVDENLENIFYELKGLLDSFLEKLGLTDVWYDEFKVTAPHHWSFLWQKGSAAEIKIGDKKIGFFGKINSSILNRLDIKIPLFAFEFDFPALMKLALGEVHYQEIPKYPAIQRDLSLLVPTYTKVVEILNVIEPTGGRLLIDTDLIDFYEGEELPEGKESLTLRLVFQSRERTLKDKEVDSLMKKIIKAIKTKDWEVR